LKILNTNQSSFFNLVRKRFPGAEVQMSGIMRVWLMGDRKVTGFSRSGRVRFVLSQKTGSLLGLLPWTSLRAYSFGIPGELKEAELFVDLAEDWLQNGEKMP